MLQIWPIPLRALLKYETFLLDQNAGEDLYFFFFFTRILSVWKKKKELEGQMKDWNKQP